VLANVTGELEFGARQEKDPRWFIDSQGLKDLWFGSTRVFLVAKKRYWEELEQLLGKRNIIQTTQVRDIMILSNLPYLKGLLPARSCVFN
jgi:hypothetical protein